MKRLGAFATICFIVLSIFAPVWGVQQVYADQNNQINPDNNGKIPDIQKIFGTTQGNETTAAAYLTNAITITPIQVRQTVAILKIEIAIAGDAAKDVDPQGVFDTNDQRGAWNAILDDDLEFNHADEGIFLELFGGSLKVLPTTDKDRVIFQKIDTYDKNTISTWEPVYPKNQALPEGQQSILDATNFKKMVDNVYITNTPYQSYNIGSHFWRLNPTKDFFGKKTISASILVKGLKPNTTYNARVRLDENQGDSIGASLETKYHALSLMNEQTSFTTTTTGGGNVQELEDQNGVSAGSSETGLTVNELGKETIYGQKVGCSILPKAIGGDGVDITGCFIQLYWNTLYIFSARILRMSAGLMDTFMAISLSSAMYKNTFIETGWTIVRDVCNIFFIFILLWTAFKMVINSHHFNANKTIVNVVIIGLLINFSLFFSRVIIDMGNISARVFYNQIVITGGEGQDDQDEATSAIAPTDVKPKAISSALANGLSFGAINNGGYEKINKDGDLNYGTIFLLITLNIIVNIVAMWVFIKVAFAFLGRVLSLWVGMIMSPFAFTSTIVEGGGHGDLSNIENLSWKYWIKNMLDASLYPAIYLFFIFLIFILIKSNFAGAIIKDVNELDATPFLIMTFFKFMFIIGLLVMSASFAKKMAGAFGGGLTDFVGKAAGFLGGAAVGVATGGLAVAGSRMLGSRAAATLAGEKGNELRKTATSSLEQLRANPANTGKTDAQLLKMQDKAKERLLSLDKRANNSYDLRQTKVAQGLSNATGLNFNAGTNLPGLGALNTERTTGGYQAMKDRKAFKDNQKEEKFKKLLGDKTVNYNGVMMTQAEAQQKAEEMKQDIADKDETLKNDPDIKKLENELKEIENAIRENKDKKLPPDINKINERKAKEADIEAAKTTIKVAFNNIMKQKWGKEGVSDTNSIDKVSSELSREARKAKDGYTKDYMRNGIFERQREVGGLTDHHGNSTANLFRKQFWSKENVASIVKAMGTGALAGAVAGPAGALVGAVAGAFGGGKLSAIQGLLRSIDRKINADFSGGKSFQDATHDISHGHTHEPHGHATYHTPHGAWLDKLFNGGISIGGGGGGHGGGHDDHGHGGGGGHH